MKTLKIEKHDLPGSMLELVGEIESSDFLSYEDEALKRMTDNAEIPGFRKGTATKAVIMKTYGDMALLEEMAHLALGDMYPKVLEEEKIDAIGRPEITITKIARGENLGFKIKTAIVPEIELPDYKKLAKDTDMEKGKEIADEDVQKALEEVRRMRVHEDMHIKMNAKGKTEHDHPEISEENLPPLDDAFASTMGPFKTIDELKAMLKENMVREEESKGREQFRISVFEKLIEKTKLEVPRILTDLELDKMLGRLKSDIERSGLSMEAYFKELKKEEKDIRSEWENDATKRAKMVLIVDAIWKAEAMQYDETILESEVKNLLSLYPEADPINIGEYVKDMMRNQKVFVFLEELKK